jgi:FAD/FMN-containing dehydrogenase
MRFAGPAVSEVLRLVLELQGPDAPDELTLQGVLALDPELGPTASVIGAWVGPVEDGPKRFAPFKALPGAFVDELGPTSYLALQNLQDRMGPAYRHYWKGQFVGDVGAGLQASILAAAAEAPADSIVLVEPIHGLAHRIPAAHAALGSRSGLANVSALGVWSDPADDARLIDWARRTVAALEPFALRGAGYLNYNSDDEPVSRLEQAFGTASFARLQAVKRRLDPDNRFRFNANIPPA